MYKPVRKPSLTIKMALEDKNDETMMMSQQLTQLVMFSNIIGKYRPFDHCLHMNAELNVAITGVTNVTKFFWMVTNSYFSLKYFVWQLNGTDHQNLDLSTLHVYQRNFI